MLHCCVKRADFFILCYRPLLEFPAGSSLLNFLKTQGLSFLSLTINSMAPFFLKMNSTQLIPPSSSCVHFREERMWSYLFYLRIELTETKKLTHKSKLFAFRVISVESFKKKIIYYSFVVFSLGFEEIIILPTFNAKFLWQLPFFLFNFLIFIILPLSLLNY